MKASNLCVYDLRCEYKKNPLGIDVLSPGLSWKIKSDARGVKQKAYQIQVSKESDNFNNLVWDTGLKNSEQSIHLEYQGKKLLSRKRYYYRVRIQDEYGHISDWSSPAFWEMGILDKNEWKAKWITPDYDLDPDEYESCSLLRKEFSVDNEIKKARLYATALGLYELRLNGNRVGDCYFAPGWTNYNKRLQYQSYDVTEMLEGKNTIAFILGDGWYKGDLMWEDARNFYGKKRAAFSQLHIEYKNGDEEIIVTDENWKSSSSPILMSEIYHGEKYDARIEKEGWDEINFADNGWTGVKKINQSNEILIAQENEPVKKIEEIKPVEIFTTPAGETVLDMGQNMVGWIRFIVRGNPGDKVVLKHAEVLDKEGNIYTDNLRLADQQIEYTLSGEGTETFEPHFTFQGFRYVKIDKYPGEPDLDNFTGVVLHSDMDNIGTFNCSNEMINKLQSNIVWGLKGNFLDVPTDCPQRNERLGWTGDAQVFISTASFIMNVAPFFTKWLRDLKVEQEENGAVPFVIPDPQIDKTMENSKHASQDEMTASSAWGDAACICPWTIYQYYGDKRILQEQYESMKLWVEYIRDQGEDEYLWNTGFHFGDWLALDAPADTYSGITSKDFIATAFYTFSTEILKKQLKF